MKFEKRAIDVLETTTHLLKKKVIESPPIWYSVVGANPPLRSHVKNPNFKSKQIMEKENSILDSEEELKKNKKSNLNKSTGFYTTRYGKASKKLSNIYRPIKLQFLEDELRDLFYKQHPWELADEKVLIEGNCAISPDEFDWSTIIQLGKKLDGESVVQRTLYLLKNGKTTESKVSLEEAYNQARYEYYQLRMAREVEVQSSKEEATLSGAVFKPSLIESSFAKEDSVISQWVEDAIIETKRIDSIQNSIGAAAGSEGVAVEEENIEFDDSILGEPEPEKKGLQV